MLLSQFNRGGNWPSETEYGLPKAVYVEACALLLLSPSFSLSGTVLGSGYKDEQGQTSRQYPFLLRVEVEREDRGRKSTKQGDEGYNAHVSPVTRVQSQGATKSGRAGKASHSKWGLKGFLKDK